MRRLLILALGLAWLTGCNRTSNEKVIGISLLTREHVFYRDMEDAMKQAAAKNGFRLIVNAGEWDLAKHQAPIENFIVQRVDAIVLPEENAGSSTHRGKIEPLRYVPDIGGAYGRGDGMIVHHVGVGLASSRIAGMKISQHLYGLVHHNVLGK